MAATRGRPSLTERRRQQTRLEIAEAAATLFAGRGYEETTVEDIASAAGISLRTFYRYCPAKEDALGPLLTSGVAQLVGEIAARPADEPLGTAVAAAFSGTTAERRLSDAGRARDLIRVMGTVPAIRTRWLAAGREMQDQLAPVLAPRTGKPADSLETRLLATSLITALSVAMEQWAWQESETPGIEELTSRAMDFLRLNDF